MNERQKPRILAIVGPTAVGKTALAISLAKELGGEILSCDSMQIYRGMDIGTAKPTKAEQAAAPHHLIDLVSPKTPYSCFSYLKDAKEVVEALLARSVLPIFCGGTGLYLDRFLSGGLDEETVDPALRERLKQEAETLGDHAMYERLLALDPEAAKATHENNRKRVLRALEIYESRGMTKTELDEQTKKVASPYFATVIGLRYTDRELLYRRIDHRVDEMIAEGLVDETKALLDDGVFEANATAAQAIGYKELFPYLRGEESFENAVEKLKQATRRYAKRQMTWFSAKPYVKWISVDDGAGNLRAPGEILQEAIVLFREDRP